MASMIPDIEKYRIYVDRFDLPEESKRELVHMVWRIMESFVDRAFGDDPVQRGLALQAPKRAGQEAGVIDCIAECEERSGLTATFHQKKGEQRE